MVIFKVTDGFQTRRFEAPSGVTFNDLKKKLSSVFPDSVSEKEDSDLILHYRDSEGDVITLSSDSELQELLNTTQQAVVKLYIPRKNAATGSTSHCHSWRFPASSLTNQFERELEELSSLFDSLIRPNTSSPSSPSKESSSAEKGSTSPGANNTESVSEEDKSEEVCAKPSTPEEDGTEKTESTSKPSSGNNGGNLRGCTGQRLSPLLLSDLLFYSPPTRRVGCQLRLTPWGVTCHC